MTNNTPDTTSAPTEATTTNRPQRRLLLPIALGVGGLLVAGAITVGAFAVAAEFADDRDEIALVPTQSNAQRPVNPITEPEDQVSTSDLEAVSAAAIAAAGGGTVTEIDRSDDPGEAWEVEVLLDNGTEVDVELAADLSVLRIDLDTRD